MSCLGLKVWKMVWSHTEILLSYFLILHTWNLKLSDVVVAVDHPDFARCPQPLPLTSPSAPISSCELNKNTRRCHQQRLATHLSCRLYQTCDHAVLLSGTKTQTQRTRLYDLTLDPLIDVWNAAWTNTWTYQLSQECSSFYVTFDLCTCRWLAGADNIPAACAEPAALLPDAEEQRLP